jgi:hypothetical protein
MKAEVVLTVSECKRLIAKGVASLRFIQEKMEKGIIVVPSGSTNAYIYEELTGQTIDKRAYLAGRTWPAANKPNWDVRPIADLVLVDGKPNTELDRFTALERMQAGDVYIKGANALNYNAGVAGVSIGNPTGGTVGGSLGHIIGRKLRLLIPVGLEKEVPYDIVEASALLASEDEQTGSVLSLWPIHGEIFTEIEALGILYGVDVIPVAAGGIAGAEGSLRLLLLGEREDIEDALAFVESIQGEPPLL